MLLEKHCWGYTMWPNEGAPSNPNGDSEAKKSDQGCKENKTNLVRKKNFLNSLLAEGIRRGPTRELRLKPTRILKQRNLIKDAKKTKKIGCEKIEKKLLQFLAHHGCIGFQEKQ